MIRLLVPVGSEWQSLHRAPPVKGWVKKNVRPSAALSPSGVVGRLRSRCRFGFGPKRSEFTKVVNAFMSAADTCAPPSSPSNAGLNAWKSARSPRQCSGSLPAIPTSVCVIIGPFIGWSCAVPNGAVGTVTICPPGSPRSQPRLSVRASMWQTAHDPVPLPDSFASYRKPRPSLSAIGVGS